jgi:hypothetical protein
MRRTFGLILASAAAFIAGGAAFGQVAGDECTNAITVTADTAVNFNTNNMTPSADAPADGPCPFLDWGASKDIWFKFTPPASGLGVITLCGSSYDTSMVVYTGTCAALTRVDCDDDTCGALYESIIEGISFTGGTTYYIRIGGWNADAGAGTMLITVEAVSGGCENATGACNNPHGTPGCNDAVCCTQVCATNPLCCDIGWDIDCVNAAVQLCGVFYYTCTPTGPANNCATNATLVPATGAYPFNSVGATMDGPDHPGSTCQSGTNTFFNDVWWKFTSAANGVCTVSTCGTVSYDNKLAIYAFDTATPDFNTLNTALVACIDDGASGQCLLTDGVTPYASALSFNALAGKTYYVRMGSYVSGQTGTGSISFTLPEACQLPTSNTTENEACGSSGNGGCNDVAGGAPVQPIVLGDKVAGTFWANAGTRDTDWYSLTLSADTQVTAKVSSGSFSTLLILGGTCTSTVTLGTGTGSCPNTATACLNAGTYKIFVAPQGFEGLPCGSGAINNYVLEVTGTSATCPVSTDVCDDPGPDNTTQSNDPNLTVGGVACGGGGTTTANTFARSFSGLTSGEIRCVEFGYSNSGGPVPVSLILCRDTNGGAPESLGTDLVELARRDLTPLAAFGTVTAKFDEPVCLDGNTSPIVVVLDIAASTTGFAVYAANTAGATGPTYLLAEACGITTFTNVADIGFGELQWVVSINGDYSGCGTGGIPGDLNGDGVVNAADLAILLGQWGGSGSADLNGDGTVSAADLAILLGSWG